MSKCLTIPLSIVKKHEEEQVSKCLTIGQINMSKFVSNWLTIGQIFNRQLSEVFEAIWLETFTQCQTVSRPIRLRDQHIR